MKHTFKCTWGKVELYVDGNKWSTEIYGSCPKNIVSEIGKLKKTRPRPDSVMAFLSIKKSLKSSLLYTI